MGRVLTEPGNDGAPVSKVSRDGVFPETAQSLPVCSFEKSATSSLEGTAGKLIGRLGELSLYAASDLGSVSETWRGFQAHALYTPFQDVDWNLSWMQAAERGEDYQPLIVFGYEQHRLCFILPLALDVKFGLSKLCWFAQSINDYNAPLLDPDFAKRCSQERAQEILGFVIDAHKQIDLYDFRQQPDKIAGQHNPFIGVNAQPSSCNAHLINLRPGWKSFFEEMRASKSRKRLRDKENRLSRLGNLQFRCEKDPVARRRLIKLALRWKLAQLTASGDHHPFAPDTDDAGAGSSVERTLLALCDLPEMRHKLRVEGLYISGEPVALIVAMVTGRQYSVFITAHSGGASSQYSPGKILLVKTIQLACRARFERFDLLAGDEDYKLSWCDETTHLWSRARGLTLKGKMVVPVIRGARIAKKKVKQNPRLLDFIKSLNKRRMMLS